MNLVRLFQLILVYVFFQNISFAFNLSPLSQSIEIGKNLNTVIYQIENKNKEPIAVESSLKVRNMKEDGKEDLPEVKESDFLIYPTQLILKPGEKRGLKIQYLGNLDIKEELAYRVLVEQLPIDFERRKQTGVKLLLRYLGALYVTKDDFKGNIVVSKFESTKEDLKFSVKNSGNKHIVFKNLSLEIINGKEKIKLSSEQLEGFIGENILAKMSRVFSVKNTLGKTIPEGSKVVLKYDE